MTGPFQPQSTPSEVQPLVLHPERHQHQALRDALALMLGYAVAALVSILISRQPGNIATVWYPNAIAAAYLATLPLSRWPLLLLAAGVANVLANLALGSDVRAAAGFLPANLGESVVAALLLQRAHLQRGAHRTPVALLKMLLLGAVLPALVGALLGAAALYAIDVAGFRRVWLSWLEGSVIGAISVLPLALLTREIGVRQLVRRLLGRPALALALLSIGSTLLAMAQLPFPFVYALVPLLLAAIVVDFAVVAALCVLESMTMAIAMGSGVFVPPPLASNWEQVFVYLPFALTLIPAQVLSSAIGQIRDSHAALAASEAQLRHANTRLEQFVRIASHDLREPLNTIEQFGRLIEQDHAANLEPAALTYFGFMRRGAARLRSLLDDVLEYVRLQEADMRQVGPVPLAEVLDEVRVALGARIAASDARLQIEPLPVVRGHAGLLALVFQNLLANAMKFVAPGVAPEVRVSAQLDDDRAIVTVEDNGIGIAAKDMPQLFGLFKRFNARREYEGTGLGLALCKQIVDAHGGEIWAESQPGHGTRFHVRLPLVPAR